MQQLVITNEARMNVSITNKRLRAFFMFIAFFTLSLLSHKVISLAPCSDPRN